MKISIGDKVQYSTKFLRSIGQYTGKLPFAKGIVIDLRDFGQVQLATIDWNDPDIPQKVIVPNLTKVRSK